MTPATVKANRNAPVYRLNMSTDCMGSPDIAFHISIIQPPFFLWTVDRIFFVHTTQYAGGTGACAGRADRPDLKETWQSRQIISVQDGYDRYNIRARWCGDQNG